MDKYHYYIDCGMGKQEKKTMKQIVWWIYLELNAFQFAYLICFVLVLVLYCENALKIKWMFFLL